MRIIERTSQFKRDIERMGKRGKDMRKFKEVLQTLVEGERLAPQYRDHPLLGQYTGSRECHIEPDWLLVYEATDETVILIRTGSQADLFR
jgi:mRNA interferase YafQ